MNIKIQKNIRKHFAQLTLILTIFQNYKYLLFSTDINHI